jgi:hypothetical protein
MTSASGLIIAGRKVLVPGLTIINSTDAAWCQLRPGDYRMRQTRWVRGVVAHSTGGNWPMPIVDAPGPGGECERYADIWATDPAHSAAHLVVDSRGTVACLADLQYVCAYHATSVNDVAIGIELAQMRDNTMHRATIDAGARLIRGICDAMGIPFQVCSTPYANRPIDRLVRGGADCVGIYGHRDQSDQRGRGDPGDAIYEALLALGAEPLDYAAGQDLERGRARQLWLNAEASRRGETWSPLVVDGLVGPASLERARRMGYGRWRDVPVSQP